MEPQFEQVLDSDVGRGTYQIVLLLLVFLFSFTSTDGIAINFLAGKVDFYCDRQNEIRDHVTTTSYLNGTTLKVPRVYIITTNNRSGYDNDDDDDDDDHHLVSSACRGECPKWVYDRSVYVSTIISEFGLICERAWLVDMISTVYMAGRLLSCLSHGYLSDRYGRKKVMIGSHVLKLIGGVMSLYSPNFLTFAVSRFIIAVGSTASCMASFVLLVESTGSAWRRKFGVMFNISVAMGGMVMSLVAYLVRDFRSLQTVYTWPQCFLLICYLNLDESPRWLASRGKRNEVMKVLQRMSLINKKEELPTTNIRFDNVVTSSSRHSRVLEKRFLSGFFNSRALSLKTAILWCSWFVSCLIYYSFSLNTGRLPGNIYLTTFFINLVEIPAIPLTIFSMERIGARMTLAVYTLAAAISCLLMIPFMYLSVSKYVVTSLGILGKGLITVSYNALYVETAETYPTKIRSQAMGISASFGRLSSMASSFLGGFMADVWLPLPSIIFGSFALFSGLSFLVFPKVSTGDLDADDVTRKSSDEQEVFALKKNDKNTSP